MEGGGRDKVNKPKSFGISKKVSLFFAKIGKMKNAELFVKCGSA